MENYELTPIEQVNNSLSLKTSYDIQDLAPHHQRFVHLYLAGKYKMQDIAKIFGFTPGTVSGWLKRDDVKSVIAQYQDEEHELVSSRLKSLAVKAVGKLGELVDSPNEQVAFSAIKDILDRTGHKASNKVEVEQNINFESKLEELVNKTIIDVDYEIVEDDYEP